MQKKKYSVENIDIKHSVVNFIASAYKKGDNRLLNEAIIERGN